MFIISLTYKVALEQVDQHISAHIDYLDKYYALGNFITSGRKVPRTGGIILASAQNQSQLWQIIQEDPFYQADVADYQITEFQPTKAAEGFDKMLTFDS